MKDQAAAKSNAPNFQPVCCAKPPPQPQEPVHLFRQLQQQLGNRRLGHRIQAKLKVSTPGDVHEQEADRVAAEVMRMPDPSGTVERMVTRQAPPRIQRMCANCEEEEVMRKEAEEGETKSSRTKPTSGLEFQTTTDTTSGIGGGQPLTPSVRDFFEPRFGYDFAQVRVHTGGMAVDRARSLNALAYSVGSDIVFGNDRYAPDTFHGKQLLAHELTHIVQQGSAPGLESNGASQEQDSSPQHAGISKSINRTSGPVLHRQTAEDEQEFAGLFEEEATPEPEPEPEPEQQLTPSNPTATAPPSPVPVPTAPGTFDPLTGSALTDRQTHGLTRDTGPMTGEIESTLFPTGGANPPCTAIPAGFETTVATSLSSHLRTDLPTLTPAVQSDPMPLANETAGEAMPIIASHYAPHARTVSAASFMTHVSRKTMAFGDPIRNDLDRFASFISWYAGTRPALRTLVGNKCNLDRAWWRTFVGWLDGAGASWNGTPHRIRERAAIYNTFFTSTTRAGQITFGLGFTRGFIPHTVVHEAMHLFQHPDLRTQINRMQQVRASTDIIIEGFAEYLARGVRDQVVTAIQAHVPPPLSAGDETRARSAAAYPEYFRKAVALRDVLYSHGQDGEESLRRAFFLGEGWRFGLLEGAGVGSPIETDRAVPAIVDVLFSNNSNAILNPAALNSIIAYVTTRSIARIEIIGRADPFGSPADNLTLGQSRADSVQTHLIAQGIDASRITATSHGEADQIPGGSAVNRRATVTVIDPRNQFPGTPAVGRP